MGSLHGCANRAVGKTIREWIAVSRSNQTEEKSRLGGRRSEILLQVDHMRCAPDGSRYRSRSRCREKDGVIGFGELATCALFICRSGRRLARPNRSDKRQSTEASIKMFQAGSKRSYFVTNHQSYFCTLVNKVLE